MRPMWTTSGPKEIVIWVVIGLGVAASSANAQQLDFSKPIYAGSQTILCNSQDDLDNLEQHVNAGVPITTSVNDLIQYGCFLDNPGDQLIAIGGPGVFSGDIKVSVKWWVNGMDAPPSYIDKWTMFGSLTNTPSSTN